MSLQAYSLRFSSAICRSSRLLGRLGITALLAACTAAYAARPVTIGFDEGPAPFMSVEHGRPTGIYPDMVRAIFADAKVDLITESAPFNRVLGNVDRGTWGAGGILKTPARLARYDYSDYLHMETLVVYYARSRPFRVREIADLRGKRVGVLLGWSYGEAFDIAANDLDIQVSRVPTDEVNFRKLQLGRLDVVIVLDEAAQRLVATGKFYDLVQSPQIFRQNPSFIAFNKLSHRQELLEKLNRSIRRLRASGRLEKIVEQHTKASPQAAVSQTPIAPPKRNAARPMPGV